MCALVFGKERKLLPDNGILDASENADMGDFSNFSYINQKEYLDCISSVKREATGEIRLNPAIEWMSQGKPKNWKYM